MNGLRSRQDYEQEERERLAPAAAKSDAAGERMVSEPEHAFRTAFQRDRDRVLHSSAFRRLEYKTQVFVHHEGDHFRNRLTHTLEGSQIARSMARALRLNEDLAEAISLAHDLGHTPFGHAGERVLDRLLVDDGGFDHNRQTLRIVDWIEERYPSFRGLNLTSDTREGLLKHGAGWAHPVPLPRLGRQPSLEAQVADRADEIAYTNHDLDDGLRSGLLAERQLEAAPLWDETHREVRARMPDARVRVVRAQTVRALIDRLVGDLLRASAARIDAGQPADLGAVRAHAEPLVGFSDEVGASFRELKRFLFEHLYDHPDVVAKSRAAEHVLGDLFAVFRARSDELPGHVIKRFPDEGEARAVADYIAGMTDRFAVAEHARLCRGAATREGRPA